MKLKKSAGGEMPHTNYKDSEVLQICLNGKFELN